MKIIPCNHLHLIIHTDKQALIEIMKKINITYAMSYNRKERRVGALFQERYKSENITDENIYIEKGITDKRQLKDKEELIVRLLKESKLSYRKIAQITETSLNTVYLVSKNNKG